MKIHLRLDSSNKEHAKMTLFINGKNSGTITASPIEAVWFGRLLKEGCSKGVPSRVKIGFEISGNFDGHMSIENLINEL
jgi:hypothetical protein